MHKFPLEVEPIFGAPSLGLRQNSTLASRERYDSENVETLRFLFRATEIVAIVPRFFVQFSGDFSAICRKHATLKNAAIFLRLRFVGTLRTANAAFVCVCSHLLTPPFVAPPSA